MATKQQMLDSIHNYLQGGAERPAWLDRYADPRVRSAVDYAKRTVQGGVNDPKTYLINIDQTLSAMLPEVNNMMPNIDVVRLPDRVYPNAVQGNGAYSQLNGGNPLMDYKPSAPTTSQPTTPGDPFGDYLSQNPGKQDAWAYLEAVLNEYGLGELKDFVKDNIIQGRSDVEIQQRLREQEVYKKRFAAIEKRKAKGLPPVSETEVVEWEKSATQLMQRAGFSPGFYDSPEDMENFIVNGWSIAELDTVINEGLVDAQNADPVVREEIERMFGPGTMTMFFIDPDRTENLVMQQYKAARAGAQARLTGYGTLATDEAQRLVALGITEDQQRSGFGQLAQSAELFQALPGQEGGISRDTQFSAAFEGNTTAQGAIERRAKERTSRFADGGSYASGQDGFAGLGRGR